jgi:hypothetical protein
MSERQFNYPPRKKPVSPQRVTNPPTRDVNAATRAAEAMKLRAHLLTYEEIARRCGYAGPSACRKAILREMDRVVVKNVDELRDAELHMLNIMHGRCWQRFMDDKNPWSHAEVERILKISERRSKLMGLDTPVDQAMNTNITLIREVPAGYLGIVEAQPS